MVYGGKPSRGCLTCRARRIKCDEGKPTCKNCAKSKRECMGYKTEFDIVHRSENRNLAKRMQKLGVVIDEPPALQPASRPSPKARQPPIGFISSFIAHPSSVPSAPTTSGKCTPGSSSSSRQNTPPSSFQHTPSNSSPSSPLLSPSAELIRATTPPPSLPVPVSHQATCYFASNFILLSNIPLHHSDGGFLSYITPLIDTAPSHSPLRHAFDACALAALGNRRKDKEIVNMALLEHTYALGRMQAALSQPGAHKDDATLAAILLLRRSNSLMQ